MIDDEKPDLSVRGQEIVSRWETGDLADVWDELEVVDFEISPEARSRLRVPVDRALYERLRSLAGARGLSVEALIVEALVQGISVMEDAA